jgi:hypothetical protein
MHQIRPALAARSSQFFHGPNFGEMLFKRAKVFGDVMLVENILGLEAIETQGLGQRKVSEVAAAVEFNEKTLFRLGFEVELLRAKLLLHISG